MTEISFVYIRVAIKVLEVDTYSGMTRTLAITIQKEVFYQMEPTIEILRCTTAAGTKTISIMYINEINEICNKRSGRLILKTCHYLGCSF